MPAKRFFKLLEAGRKIENKKKFSLYTNLCDIAAITIGEFNYYEKIRQSFFAMTQDRQLNQDRDEAMDPTDPMTVGLMNSIFTQLERYN